MAVDRNINYINRDFSDFRTKLIDFSKTYFPTTYNDFSPSSPGMLFIEMASYVGDVLSFYLDNQIQENFIQYARQTNNLYQLAYMFGYKPKTTGAATVVLDLYQQVPAKDLGGGNYVPDLTYTLAIDANAVITSNTPTASPFLLQDSVDFSISSSYDPTEITIYQVDGSNNPLYYLLKKQRQAVSGLVNTTTYSFGSPQKFTTVQLTAGNFIGILDVIDSDGNVWYEVDYLAQDMVYDSIRNTNINDPKFSTNNDAPYLLKLKSVQRRFVTRLINDNTLEIQFGAGTVNSNDATVVPNPDNVGLGLPYGQSKLNTAYDPTNFIFTNTYGIAPANTTLTVRYLTGGGVDSNALANTLNKITGNIRFTQQPVDVSTSNYVFNSLFCTNELAASGGGDGDTIEEIRQNTIGVYNSQLRAVTQDDYTIRALSLPAKYGSIAKAYVEQTRQSNVTQGEIPSTLDLYVLGYTSAKNLTTLSQAVKTNLSNYLSQFRIVGDSVRILDAFVVNIGVDFEITVLPNYVSAQVLNNCIGALKNHFAVASWQINQPIILREVYNRLQNIAGVQSVVSINVNNKVEGNYSPYAYDIEGATVGNVVYPSLDPSIFEVRYPDNDITGRVVTI